MVKSLSSKNATSKMWRFFAMVFRMANKPPVRFLAVLHPTQASKVCVKINVLMLRPPTTIS